MIEEDFPVAPDLTGISTVARASAWAYEQGFKEALRMVRDGSIAVASRGEFITRKIPGKYETDLQ